MSESNASGLPIISKLFLTAVVLLVLSTAFFYPSSSSEIIVNRYLQPLGGADVVRVSPIFGKSYSFILSPSMDDYAAKSEGQLIFLSQPGTTTSFAVGYWIAMDLIPSVVISCMVAWFFWRSPNRPRKDPDKMLGSDAQPPIRPMSDQANGAPVRRCGVAGVLLLIAGPSALGLTTTDPTNPSGLAILMALLSFGGAAYSFAEKRKPALVCAWIFAVVTGISAFVKSLLDPRYRLTPISIIAMGGICGGVGCMLAIFAILALGSESTDQTATAEHGDGVAPIPQASAKIPEPAVAPRATLSKSNHYAVPAMMMLAVAVLGGIVWYLRSHQSPPSGSTKNASSNPDPIRDLNLAVVTTDGATHDIRGVELSSGNDLHLQSFGFSTDEMASFIILTDAESPREEQMFIRREFLESSKQTYHALILPISAVERLGVTGLTIRSPERDDIQPDYGNHYYTEVSATMRSGEVLHAVASENLKQNFASSGPHQFKVRGTEDLHEFGKAPFTNSLGDGSIKEIRFPSITPTLIATRSALTAVITEVGGRSTTLSDLRFDGATTLTFAHTGATVHLNPSDVQRIELREGLYDGNTNAIAPTRIAASVRLNSGTQQDFDWEPSGVIGKAPGGWYEWIPGAALKTIDFAAARH